MYYNQRIMKKKIIIGTRGSKLALIQTQIIKTLLEPLLPETIIQTVIIKTTGDKNMKPIHNQVMSIILKKRW